VNCEQQAAMLKKIQEIEFVAVELNLFLDTHPKDGDALNDYNCAAEMAQKYRTEYEQEYGPLVGFGIGGFSRGSWLWEQGPWPWEL
jgi:spore coat protein JB